MRKSEWIEEYERELEDYDRSILISREEREEIKRENENYGRSILSHDDDYSYDSDSVSEAMRDYEFHTGLHYNDD